MPLMTGIRMDKFHDNYDREKNRADSLDNIIAARVSRSLFFFATHRKGKGTDG